MTAWETDDEYATAAHTPALPSPSNSSLSSQARTRRKSPSPGQFSSSPPSSEHEAFSHSSDIGSKKEGLSMFNPDRFTPTLHANLVSEILSLRRAQEAKKKQIEDLEASLYESRGEREAFSAEIVAISKENYALKRKLDLMEAGSSSTIAELTKERDDAREATLEVRRRLESANKKIRSQDGEIDRTNALWARDKSVWEEEKRKIERKLHVTENRLIKVIEEVSSYEINQQPQLHVIGNETELEDNIPENFASDNDSVRTKSLTNSGRSSMPFGLMGLGGGRGGTGGGKQDGLSLADELALYDVDEEMHDNTDGESIHAFVVPTANLSLSQMATEQVKFESYTSTVNQRNSLSTVESSRPSSMSSINQDDSTTMIRRGSKFNETSQGVMTDLDLNSTYVHTGIQYSPPPSPPLPHLSIESDSSNESRVSGQFESHDILSRLKKSTHSTEIINVGVDTRCKFVQVDFSVLKKRNSILLAENPILPISSDDSKDYSNLLKPSETTPKESRSSSTQTDENAIVPIRKAPPPPVIIPSIQLHPPLSASSQEHFLLPQYKNFGCQASIEEPTKEPAITSRSISMQTEEIRVDKRLQNLPPHLLPSVISSNPPSPPEPSRDNRHPSSSKFKRQSPPRGLINSPVFSSEDPYQHDLETNINAYTEENKNHHHEDRKTKRDKSLRKKTANNSVSAFDNISSDEDEYSDDDDLSQSSFRTPLSAPQPRRTSPGTCSSQEDFHPTSAIEVDDSDESLSRHEHSFDQPLNNLDMNECTTTPEISGTSGRCLSLTRLSSSKGRLNRSCSANLPLMANDEPPFPIPMRNSSRRPIGAPSTPFNEAKEFPHWQPRNSYHRRTASIRKVRSATMLSTVTQSPSDGRTCQSSHRSPPPPVLHSTEGQQALAIPPLPVNNITHPRSSSLSRDTRISPGPSSKKELSEKDRCCSMTPSQTTSIVSAIAQTMIGEWVYKYTRHRKSRGVSESNLNLDKPHGSRHKRWIWLAPYERAVMWSSKEPISGSALLGKTGRKLIIQSVLDVKDENTGPKGASLAPRSILVFTPTRALKFTAPSLERHHIWMTALSFLANSSEALMENPNSEQFSNQYGTKSRPQSSRRRKIGSPDSCRSKAKPSLTSRSRTGSTYSGQRINEYDPSLAAEVSCLMETSKPAAAPIVPRFTERTVSHSSSPNPNSFMPMYRRRTNSTRNSPLIPSCRTMRSETSNHISANSTTGLSIAASETSDIYGYNPKPLPSTALHSNPCTYIPNTPVFYGHQNSVNSDIVSPMNWNILDPLGTVCMQAFVNPPSNIESRLNNGSIKSYHTDEKHRQENAKESCEGEYGPNFKHRWVNSSDSFEKFKSTCNNETTIYRGRCSDDNYTNCFDDDEANIFSGF